MQHGKPWYGEIAAHVSYPELVTPLDFGWQLEQDILSPVYYKWCSASELIDSLKCECGLRQMCSAGCPYYQSRIPCIELLYCHGRCNNVLPSIQDEIEDIDELKCLKLHCTCCIEATLLILCVCFVILTCLMEKTCPY